MTAVLTAPAPAGRATREPPRAARWALIGIVVLPIATAVIRALRNEWFPIGDSALLYLRARDVLTADHPLLGSWTSASQSVGENMNNPGALYDYLVAPTSRLLPFSSAAAIGVGLVNAVCVVGIAAAGRAIGGWAMQRWMLLACAALTWIMGSELLIDIWQAHALLLPFLAYLVLLVGLAEGQWRWLPWAAAVASLLVQTHISYVFVLAAATATAGVVAAATHWPVPWRHWRAAVRSRVAVTTGVVVLVCWAQPFWEQLFGPGKGNLARLLTNASGGDTKLGLSLGIRLSANILVQPLWRLRSGFGFLVPNTGTTQGPDGPFVEVAGPLIGLGAALLGLAVLVGGLATLAIVLRRHGARAASSACWITLGLVVSAPAALSLVTVGLFFAPHHVRWLWAFGAFMHIVAGWGVVELVVRRWRRLAPAGALAPLALAVVLALAAVPFAAQAQGPVADYWSMPVLRRVFRDLEPLRDSAPVVYDTSQVRVFEPFSAAVMMRMQELGIEFRTTDEGMVRQLGERRRADGTERTRIFQVQGVDAILDAGDACLISRASSLDPDDEAAARAALDAVVAGIGDGTITIDAAALDEPGAAAAAVTDPELARRLVLDGTLGADALRGPGDLAAQIDLVRRWERSAYALYADDPVTCPT